MAENPSAGASSPVNYEAIIRAEAVRQGVPPDIAVAMAKRETGMRHFDARGEVIRGAAGEVGIMQLMPGTAREVNVDPFNAEENIRGGVAYLRKQFARFEDWEKSLQAYNGGAKWVIKNKVSADAREYARAVLAAADALHDTDQTENV